MSCNKSRAECEEHSKELKSSQLFPILHQNHEVPLRTFHNPPSSQTLLFFFLFCFCLLRCVLQNCMVLIAEHYYISFRVNKDLCEQAGRCIWALKLPKVIQDSETKIACCLCAGLNLIQLQEFHFKNKN